MTERSQRAWWMRGGLRITGTLVSRNGEIPLILGEPDGSFAPRDLGSSELTPIGPVDEVLIADAKNAGFVFVAGL